MAVWNAKDAQNPKAIINIKTKLNLHLMQHDLHVQIMITSEGEVTKRISIEETTRNYELTLKKLS